MEYFQDGKELKIVTYVSFSVQLGWVAILISIILSQ